MLGRRDGLIPSSVAQRRKSIMSSDSNLPDNYCNIRINDVPTVFAAIADNGQYRAYAGLESLNLYGHVQGMASYHRYYLMTHSEPVLGTGKIAVINRDVGK